MESVLQNQQQLADVIGKMVINMKKDSADRKSVDYFKRRLEMLESYWSDFQYNHDRLCTEASRGHPYFIEREYDRVHAVYVSTKAYIVEKSQALVKQPTGESSPKRREKEDECESVSGERGCTQHLQPTGSRSTGSSSKLDEMLRKQASNFRAFLRTIDGIELASLTQKWELEDALKTLKSRWSTIDSLHLDIDSELEGSDEAYQRSFVSHEATYNDMKKQINCKLWSESHKDSWTPKMDIPLFNGDYKNWVSFKDLFTEVIHNNISIPNAQKMQFLKGKLRGEAERLLQHLQISSDNYSVCWEILNNRYNNIRLIFTSHINTLLNLPNIQQQSVTHIKKIHDTTHECMNAIKNLGVDTGSWDPLIVHILLQKLDTESHNHYLEMLKNPRELPKLQDFLQFLENRFTMLESARKKCESSKSSNHLPSNININHKTYKLNNYTKQSLPTYKGGHGSSLPSNNFARSNICPLCKEQHGIYFCNKFLNMTPQLKCSTIKKLNICENCLYDHKDKACLSEKRCRECKGKHNTLLHEALKNPSCNITIDLINSDEISTASGLQQGNTETLLATAIIKVKASNGSYHQMRALIDQGSQVSLISEKAAQALELSRRHCKGVVSGIGTKESRCKGVAKIACVSLYGEFSFKTEVFIMQHLVKNLPSCTFSKPSWSHLEGIQLSDPDFNVSRPVDILLGADVYSQIIMDGISRSDQALPIAQQTRLGWILCGNVQTLQCNVVLNRGEDLHKFWEIEDIAESSSLSEEDSQCVSYYKSTTRRRADGSYEVRIPMRENFQEKLGASKHAAIAQFRQLEQKFHRNQNIEQQYKLFINEYLTLGHMKPSISNQTPTFYLPHHCVIRDESTTTALRVVFNASRNTTSGFSLNDLMLKGPNLQQDLQSLLLRWRQFKYAFTADIEKMFRCIWVNEEDQALQKIIWRDFGDVALKEYQLCTVTYGTKAAPFLAMMTLRQLAEDEKLKYKDAARILEQSFYMDDVLYGSNSVESALKIQQDLISLLRLGRFNLRKWKSNCSALLQNTTDMNQHFEFKQLESTKTLGIRWNPKQDLFIFQSQFEPVVKKFTKRCLLSDVSRLYDPLGWLSPISTKLKLLFQKVWTSNVQWDDQLSDEIVKEWFTIREDMAHISQFQLPRWLGTAKESSQIELHGFCDSSNKAYACVIYCKVQTCDNIDISLVAGKARLVPVNKNISLPKLELSGALLLTKLMSKVQESLSNYNIRSYGWTDSMVTLAWIQGDPGRWKPFVANRVRQICKVMPSNNWHYVKSAENPADCASRGISAEQLKEHPLWWKGPLWLPSYKTPQPEIFTTDEEAKAIKIVGYATEISDISIVDILLDKYSSFQKLTRVFAWVLKFIKCLKQGRFQQGKHLTLQELNQAKHLIIRHVQSNAFSDEISTLQQNKLLHVKSKLLQFNPFLSKDGLLRVGGRLNKASMNPQMIHPIILPHSSRLTDLIIDYAHQLTLHGGARVTLAAIRQRYWIIGGNRAVKKHLQGCVTCRKHNPVKITQIMGDLPSQRCNQAKPFYHTGVDFTGHVMIKANKGRGIKTTKGYIAVFVCMVTKIVHLELVSDLSSSAFLAALRRMAARKGSPRHIYCDNGTNFVGASNIMAEEFQEVLRTFDKDFITDIANMEIEWHFNAPSWPSAGGLWEAAVKSVKYHLRRVIGEQRLTFEEYSTVLAQIEAVLNSRPLCPLTEDVNDLEFLTPSSFINMNQDMTVLETETDMRTRWYLTQRIVQDVWTRWRSEYLSQLTARSKWNKAQPNIQINDVVTINDANLPPGKWAVGRVVDLHPGTDGHVRVVTLQTKNGLIKRPVIKLSVLPVHDKRKDQDGIVNQPNVQTSNRPKPAKHSFVSLLTLLLFIMSILSTGHCSYNVTQMKNNQGLYFEKVANMRLIRDEWKIVSYYDMATYWRGTKACNTYIKYLEQLCTKLGGNSHCDVLSVQLQLEYSELDYNNNLLLRTGTRRDKRKRRGLINGVGYLANTLFGVLDDEFAEQYKRDIQLTRDNENHLASLIKNQTSIIEVEYNILKRTEDSLDKQHKMLNQLSLKIVDLTQTLNTVAERNQFSNEFSLVAIAASNLLRQLETIQSTLLDTLLDVYQGRFNFHLISQAQLQDTLSTISSHLTKDLSLPIKRIGGDFKIFIVSYALKQRCARSI